MAGVVPRGILTDFVPDYGNLFYAVHKIKRLWGIVYSFQNVTSNEWLFSGYYLKRLAYLLYGSVASLPSPSSNIEAWPYGTSLRFAVRALGVCEHS